MLSKEVSSTIFWVFGMTRPGIEPRSPGPLANILTTRPMSGKLNEYLLSSDFTIWGSHEIYLPWIESSYYICFFSLILFRIVYQMKIKYFFCERFRIQIKNKFIIMVKSYASSKELCHPLMGKQQKMVVYLSIEYILTNKVPVLWFCIFSAFFFSSLISGIVFNYGARSSRFTQ